MCGQCPHFPASNRNARLVLHRARAAALLARKWSSYRRPAELGSGSAPLRYWSDLTPFIHNAFDLLARGH
jgi:hypothetical protein